MRRDYKDLLAGGAILAFGVALAAYAALFYEMGSLRQMGRGMFPFGVGCFLVACGLAIGLPALARPGTAETIEVRAAAAILAAVAVFALGTPRIGMIPSILIMTLIASLAGTRLTLLGALVLGLILAGLAWLVFGLGLGMTIVFFNWPF